MGRSRKQPYPAYGRSGVAKIEFFQAAEVRAPGQRCQAVITDTIQFTSLNVERTAVGMDVKFADLTQITASRQFLDEPGAAKQADAVNRSGPEDSFRIFKECLSRDVDPFDKTALKEEPLGQCAYRPRPFLSVGLIKLR